MSTNDPPRPSTHGVAAADHVARSVRIPILDTLSVQAESSDADDLSRSITSLGADQPRVEVASTHMDAALPVALVLRFEPSRVVPARGGRLVGEDLLLTEREAFVRTKRGDWIALSLPLCGERDGPIVARLSSGARVPGLVEDLVRVALIARGVLPVHASGFVLRGCGILATGWAHGAKTGTLLRAMEDGGSFVGDDWVFLASEGRRMRGLSGPLRVSQWYLKELPSLARRVPPTTRLRIGAFAKAWHGLRGSRGKIGRRLESACRRRAGWDVTPERLFGENVCRYEAPLDRVLLLATHASSEIHVESVTCEQAVETIVAALEQELHGLVDLERRVRFATGAAHDRRLADVFANARGLAERALRERSIHRIVHPYPVSIRALHAHLARLLDA